MSPYRFRLATFLKLREQDRDQRRTEHAQALEAERILLQQKAELTSEREAMQAATRSAKQPGQVNVDALQEMQRYSLLLQAKLAGLEKQIAQVSAEVERRRLAVVEADRNVKTLEKLREKQLAAHERLVDALDRKELDELALGGFVRATRNAEALP
jgi:flagellar FliJ protein